MRILLSSGPVQKWYDVVQITHYFSSQKQNNVRPIGCIVYINWSNEPGERWPSSRKYVLFSKSPDVLILTTKNLKLNEIVGEKESLRCNINK